MTDAHDNNSLKSRLSEPQVEAAFLSTGSVRETALILGVDYFVLSQWCNRKRRKTWWRGLRTIVIRRNKQARNKRFRDKVKAERHKPAPSRGDTPRQGAFNAISQALTGPLE